MTDQEKDMREESQENNAAADAEAAEQQEQGSAASDENAYEWKEPPVFDITHKEDCVCEVKITIPKANISAMLDEVYEEVNDGVQVPGFRRGKAPRKLLEKRLGKYARGNAAEKLADHAARLLTEEHKLIPIAKADVVGLEDAENLSEDQDMCYTITFETAGKCTIGAWQGLEIEKPVIEVADKDVDETVDSMRTRYGRYEPLTEGAAENGDQVIIDFEGKIDGEPFEGNSAENYPYILGSGRFAPEMEAAIHGKKTGEAATAELTFPEDYRSAEIAGKTAHFEIKINEIKRRVLPELTDEFAKRLGHDTVEELRESVRKRISENAGENVQEYMSLQARRKLVDCCTFELPKSQVQYFADTEYQSMENRMREQHLPAEYIEEQREEMRKAADEQGMLAIKSMYAIREFAKQESITINETDFENYALRASSQSRVSHEAMKEYLLSDDMRSMTEYQILEQKVLDRVIEKAAIVLKTLTDDDEAADKEKADA